MTKELIDAIQRALDNGFRVEIIKLKSGKYRQTRFPENS